MINIRLANSEDAEAICAIYNYYVTHTAISFEESEVSPPEMSRRIHDVSENFPWLVMERDGIVDGYAYASKWRTRSAYRFSVEASVYLSPGSTGSGYGASLYENLLDQLIRQGVHVVIAGISLPNDASVRFHEKMGFKKVAQFEQVGFKNQQWADVGYWQKLI